MSATRRALLAAAVAAGAWLLLAGVDRAVAHRLALGSIADADDAATPTTPHAEAPAASWPSAVLTTLAPIAAEALVFRTRPDQSSVAAAAARRPDAHPRTLATYRALRAFPGAPPRVPHGLTPDEFSGSTCNTCHLRGGYSARFRAYVPLTPHPEFTDCLQCHATDAAIVGTPLPDDRADAPCRQCHAPARRQADAPLAGWRPAAWPELGGPRHDGTPPEIPHDLQLRGNCLACHMGPGAVAEIRTLHPDRASCRQCHLAVIDDAGFPTTDRAGGAP